MRLRATLFDIFENDLLSIHLWKNASKFQNFSNKSIWKQTRFSKWPIFERTNFPKNRIIEVIDFEVNIFYFEKWSISQNKDDLKEFSKSLCFRSDQFLMWQIFEVTYFRNDLWMWSPSLEVVASRFLIFWL